MFLIQCDNLGTEALVWASDVHGITNTDNGIVVNYRCVCGEIAEMLTGSGSEVKLSVHLGLAA